jgi:hypothetical protein
MLSMLFSDRLFHLVQFTGVDLRKIGPLKNYNSEDTTYIFYGGKQ